jgi:hypothetical protein
MTGGLSSGKLGQPNVAVHVEPDCREESVHDG